MKTKSIRILSLLLAMIFIAGSALVGCSSSVDTSSAITYGDFKVSRAVFLYLCSVEKTEYLYEAYGYSKDEVSSSQLQDNAMIWTATDSTGLTAAANLKMEVMQDIQVLLYLAQYAKDQGYVLTNEQKSQIREEFNSMIQIYETKKKFNQSMEAYGVDYDQLLEYNYLQTLAYKGNELLFGEEGSMKVSDDTAKTYFNKNYITIGSIFINTKNKTYPNGKVVVLPADEKAQKEQLANDIMTKLNAGEDFVTLCKEHSDRGTDETAEKGYTFPANGFENATAEKKAFELQEGEYARVDVDGGVYIIRRMALDATYFQQAGESIRNNLESVRKFTLVADNMSKYVLDEDFINGVDISQHPHMACCTYQSKFRLCHH